MAVIQELNLQQPHQALTDSPSHRLTLEPALCALRPHRNRALLLDGLANFGDLSLVRSRPLHEATVVTHHLVPGTTRNSGDSAHAMSWKPGVRCSNGGHNMSILAAEALPWPACQLEETVAGVLDGHVWQVGVHQHKRLV